MNAGVFSGSYKWRLNDISKMKEKEVSSPAFYVGSYRWCISFFPQGDEDTPVPDSISVYLVCLSCKDYPTHHIQAQFKLSIINQLDPKRSYSNRLENMFSNEDSNWGDPKFFSISKLYNENSGFVVDDTIVLEAQVTIQQNKKVVVLEDVMDAICFQLDQLQLVLRQNEAGDSETDLRRAQLLASYADTLINLQNATSGNVPVQAPRAGQPSSQSKVRADAPRLPPTYA